MGFDKKSSGSAVGDWETCTCTISSDVEVGTQVYKCRTEGDSLRIRGQLIWTGSGTDNNPFRVILPAGNTIDTAKLPGGTGAVRDTATELGMARWYDANVGTIQTDVIYATTTSVQFIRHAQTSIADGNDFAINDHLNFDFLVPLA